MQILEKSNKESEEDIIKNEIKTQFGVTLVIIIFIILITSVAMTGVYLDYW
jgi:cytochrome c-type biogenesis protein CcmH/NrfG